MIDLWFQWAEVEDKMYLQQVTWKVASCDAETSFEGTFAYVEHAGWGKGLWPWEFSKAYDYRDARDVQQLFVSFFYNMADSQHWKTDLLAS